MMNELMKALITSHQAGLSPRYELNEYNYIKLYREEMGFLRNETPKYLCEGPREGAIRLG